MDKDKKRNLLIITLLILAVLMIAFVVWWQFIRSAVENINLNTSTNNANTQEVLINMSNPTADLNVNVAATEEEKLSIQRLANIFTERFGSYTSESEFKNTLDLQVYMTDSMIIWSDDYVASQQDSQPTDIYYSIITKVLSTDILAASDTEATVELLTQRTESGDDFEQSNIFSQKIELEMEQDNDVWLVNKVVWGDKL